MKTYMLLFSLASMMACQSPSKNNILRLDSTEISKDSLSRHLEDLVHKAELSGLSVQVFNNYQLAYRQNFGYANLESKEGLISNHVYYGASLSKAVFGYLVAQLVWEGELELDRPLQEYFLKPIPDLEVNKDWRSFKDLKGDLRYEKITARMCMNHSSGLPNWRWITKEGIFDAEGKLHFFSDPGERYSYSGEGMNLLQYVIEDISGKDLETLAKERIFDPLEMDMTSYVWQERFEERYCLGHRTDSSLIPKDRADEPGAAGSMETTPVDYAKFFGHILKSYREQDPRIKLMFDKHISIYSKKQFGPDAWIDTDANKEIELGYGMGWGLLQSPYGIGAFKEGHGEGFQHYSIMFPDQGTGIILMSNSDNAESIFKEILEVAIADIYTPWEWENYIPYDKKE